MLKVVHSAGPHYPPMVVPSRLFQSIDSLDVDEVLALYREHGALLFRGFRLTKKNFWTFGGQYCSSFVRNGSGGRSVISKDTRVQTVGCGGDLFPFHPEIARDPWKPDLAMFGCLSAPKEGGETLISDGCEVVKAMSPALRDELMKRQFHYLSTTSPEVCQRWLEIEDIDAETLERLKDKPPFRFTLNEDGSLLKLYVAPALHKPMFTDDLAFGSFLLFSRFFHSNKHFPVFEDGSEVADELCTTINELAYSVSYAHSWQKGDVLMLDNTRFMHARPDFNDDGNRLIMSQFGFLGSAPISAAELATQPWRQKPIWVESDQL